MVAADGVDEEELLKRINAVKENIGRQIRKTVEQHHPRLVEQASALQNLDRVQAAISREMAHLNGICEQFSECFRTEYEKLHHTTNRLEQLYALRRILSAANRSTAIGFGFEKLFEKHDSFKKFNHLRCEQLTRRLETTNELVKRSEMVCELEAISAEIPSLKDIECMRETVLATIPRLAAEVRRSAASQLKSSLESLSAPLVSSSVRALRNLSSYDTTVGIFQNYDHLL
ncbi:unnamed protein product [Gongylonema pulchrum]|uniref:Uncharacterized protein n=1 Tax=Gongylonema pulchrum TaxID=637853 RepID=A0A3P7NY46_9BILA|nr:unnamed protein product [Gongylonema pulchrum]